MIVRHASVPCGLILQEKYLFNTLGAPEAYGLPKIPFVNRYAFGHWHSHSLLSNRRLKTRRGFSPFMNPSSHDFYPIRLTLHRGSYRTTPDCHILTSHCAHFIALVYLGSRLARVLHFTSTASSEFN